MILHPTPVSSNNFTLSHDPNDLLVTEISDLGDFDFGRVYDDACDVGLTLVDAATGRERVYAVTAEERDAEGDLLYWELTPVGRTPYALAVDQQLHKLVPSIRIYND